MKTLILLLTMFSLISCGSKAKVISTEDFSNAQDEAKNVIAIEELSNAEDLAFISSLFDAYNENYPTKQAEMNIALTDRTEKFFSVEYDSVIIKDKISEFFSPDNFSCQLPDRIKRKIKEDPDWPPQNIENKFEDLPTWALHSKDAAVSVVLNTLTIKREDGTEFSFQVTGSPTYSSLDVSNYIDNVRDEFAYALDCSGYLNAVLSAGLNLSKADIAAMAKVSMDKAGSLLLARAYLFSPLYVAIRPSSFPTTIKLSSFDRLAILYAIFKALPSNISDMDEITSPLEIEVVWSSISGNSKFNGETSLKSNVDVNIGGIASLAFNTQAGILFSTTSHFKDFETYIVKRDVVPIINPINISEIKSLIIDLTKSAVIEKPTEIVNGKIKFAVRFPKSYKELIWRVKEEGYRIDEIELDPEENLCSFIISGPNNASNTFITLITTTRGIELSREIGIPRNL